MNDPQNQLIVFSDDWGRHPSSCQHLVRHLLPRWETLWVNTIGTRPPGLSVEDLGKITEKLRQWATPIKPADTDPPDHIQPHHNHQTPAVVSPIMWPGFSKPWQRRFNANRITRAIHRALGHRRPDQKRVALTTLPITADLPGRVDVDRWVYYCVDDFSVWPGLDGPVMQAMEEDLTQRIDQAVAVSTTLQQRLSDMGRPSSLLTHGIDLEHWAARPDPAAETEHDHASLATPRLPAWWQGITRPIIVFWGLVDRRLDTDWCLALTQSLEENGGGTLLLIGPTQSPDPKLEAAPNLMMPGPVEYDDLPAVAANADVLVMPYADLPVTRAIQPLKFKEYLCTGKPVVARDLPATGPWADTSDLTDSKDRFVELVHARIRDGLPNNHEQARQRLQDETWAKKAQQLEAALLAQQ